MFLTQLAGTIPKKILFRSNSKYVSRMKLLQEAKENDRKCHALLKRGQFILFYEQKPLLTTTTSSSSSAAGPTGPLPPPPPDNAGGGRRPSLASASASRHLQWQLAITPYEGLISNYAIPRSMIDASSVFLDFKGSVEDSEEPRFALEIPTEYHELAEKTAKSIEGRYFNQRASIFLLPEHDACLVSQAISQLNWKQNFKFCPRCGHEMQRNASGTQKRCYSCKNVHYPHISPVAITLLTNESGDECLLVRQPQFVNGMFTAIAGYIETGETLEEAVRREVAEEVGLEVRSQRYLRSQHWPFPSNTLMLACLATVDRHQPVVLDGKELEEARWFTVSQLQEAIGNAQSDPYIRIENKKNLVFVPPRGAVAHEMIKFFLDNYKLANDNNKYR